MYFAKDLVTAAFKVAVWAGIGAGIVGLTDSPAKEQKRYPSLSAQDAGKKYHDDMRSVAEALAGIEMTAIIFASTKRESEPGPA
jgi:hypothetical protein